MEYNSRDVERFHRLIDKSGDCWLWQAAKDKDGYGFFKLRGKMIKAHRFMWQLLNGIIPSEILVCHHCDNPSCVNPRHLFVGTIQGNRDDQTNKGRNLLGEDNPASKLSAADVREIRFLAQTGKTQTELAKKFNVSQVQIGRILNEQCWHGV